MATIKRNGDKIILKNGKVSCTCCGCDPNDGWPDTLSLDFGFAGAAIEQSGQCGTTLFSEAIYTLTRELETCGWCWNGLLPTFHPGADPEDPCYWLVTDGFICLSRGNDDERWVVSYNGATYTNETSDGTPFGSYFFATIS
jgi:hypothetical protein